ncbi:MAG: class I SAM-dependent rRNA methyltransferase [Chloroflexi bacterium]|nr:class I SAM-dependent rRNA methyltransferase [Chloroflexota bacterium]
MDGDPVSSPAANIAIRVTGSAERALREGHPWVFADAIRKQSRSGQPGDLAVVFDRKGRFLAVGLYDPGSLIRVRVLQHLRPATIDRAWFVQRIARSVEARRSWFGSDTTGYRLVHGGSDGLPGLVVDRYDGTLVVKLYSMAWLRYLDDLQTAILQVMHAERIVLRLSRIVARQSARGIGAARPMDGSILSGAGLDRPVVFAENGLKFEVDPVRGHKTGFYLDQRENRKIVEGMSNGLDVLNVFAYTGAFSVYAARGGARSAVSIDASRPALAVAERNFALNLDVPAVRACAHSTAAADAFDALVGLAESRKLFDLVVLDPPSFTSRRASIANALAAYGHLVRLGLRVLRVGGTLVMASCSSQVGGDQFFRTVHETAFEVGRRLCEIARTGHASDHPIGFRESEYLKCLFARAD